MDWRTSLSTLLGAVIGIAATLLADSIRSRRERQQQRRQTLERTYPEYLAVLTRCHEALRTTAFLDGTANSNHQVALRQVFQESGCYEWRYRMGILATSAVIEASEETFRRLRTVRDVLIDGATEKSSEYLGARDAYVSAMQRLRARMRKDLGVDAVFMDGGS